MNTIFRILVGLFCVTWLFKEALIPGFAALWLSIPYMSQVSTCDQAMEADWYLRQAQKKQLDASTKIALLDCHDYDKTRKVLLMSGLPEDYLSWLELRSLEIHQRPADELIEAHKFLYR